MMTRLVAGLASVLFLAGPAVGAPDWAAVNIQSYAPPKPAPGFSLPDLEGKPRSLTDLSGKVVLVFFWTTW